MYKQSIFFRTKSKGSGRLSQSIFKTLLQDRFSRKKEGDPKHFHIDLGKKVGGPGPTWIVRRLLTSLTYLLIKNGEKGVHPRFMEPPKHSCCV